MKKVLMIIAKLVVIIICIWYSLKLVTPEYQIKEHLNDLILWTNQYKNMVELKIEDQLDFIMAIDKEGKVMKTFLTNKDACILKEQEIEGKTISESLDILISVLVRNDKINKNSNLLVIRNNESYYSDFSNNLVEQLTMYSLNSSFTEKKESLEDLGKRFSISSSNEKLILMGINIYSNNIEESCTSLNQIQKEELKEEVAKELSDTLYKRISIYVKEKGLSDFLKDEVPISLERIPADENGLYYSTQKSWYYAKEGKIYAYIEFTDKIEYYDFCYEGSIEEVKRGECAS